MKKGILSLCAALFLMFSLLSCGPAASDPSGADFFPTVFLHRIP